jgi:hypothetical protein
VPIATVELVETSPTANAGEASTSSTHQASLFDLATHDVTVALTDDELARLQRRARQLGVTVEDALRGLI